MSSPGDAAAELRAQLAAVTAERDEAVARAITAEAAAAAALQRVASLERLLAHDSSGSDGSDGSDGAEAETAQAGVPTATRPGDLERRFGDAAAEPPAPEGANPFAARFDPAQEVRDTAFRSLASRRASSRLPWL